METFKVFDLFCTVPNRETLYIPTLERGNEKKNTRINAIKLSQGEHAGSPLQPMNTLRFVGAYLCVCPPVCMPSCVYALNLMALTLRLLPLN
ncbi:hypothetical protein QUF54_03320 [Candidatus Marithioploca araucensis]|uniref:Uncharacterized protein n=1 Tax=Candidatus Marithioploca araucensis TaxID=70273 RepID=A0ABT7VRR2_9GAMM|nr:hypothetical protein [Candidatus Marithioploca araucensis]